MQEVHIDLKSNTVQAKLIYKILKCKYWKDTDLISFGIRIFTIKWWSPLKEGLLMFGTPMRDILTLSPGWIPEGIWRSLIPSTVSTWSYFKISMSNVYSYFGHTSTNSHSALENTTKIHAYQEHPTIQR